MSPFFDLQRGDAIEFRLQGFQTSSFDSALVHARGPVVANLLLDRTARCVVLAGGFERLAENSFIPQFETAAGAPVNLVGRNRIGGEPFVAGVLVKVVAGIERLVDQVRVEAFEFRFFRVVGACGHRGAGDFAQGTLGENRLGKGCRDGQNCGQHSRKSGCGHISS